MLLIDNIHEADIIMMETDLPPEIHQETCELLSKMHDGAMALTYHDMRKIWALGSTCSLQQLEVNKNLTDRFPTSWSVQRGHHFYLWKKVGSSLHSFALALNDLFLECCTKVIFESQFSTFPKWILQCWKWYDSQSWLFSTLHDNWAFILSTKKKWCKRPIFIFVSFFSQGWQSDSIERIYPLWEAIHVQFSIQFFCSIALETNISKRSLSLLRYILPMPLSSHPAVSLSLSPPPPSRP